MNKPALALMLIIATSSLMIVESVFAQSITKPSVPDFTLNYVDHSYDIPPKPSSSTDPYTGNTITTTIPGYHVSNKTIDATITNNGATYYNFRYKGHYEDHWSYYPFNPNYGLDYFLPDAHEVPFHASTSTHTVLSLYFLPDISVNGEIDIQVQALFGDFRAVPYVHVQPVGGPTYDFYYEGQTSDWGPTQMIKIGEASTSTSPSPTSPTTSPNPTTTQTPAVTPITPDTNSDSTNLITLPLEIFVIIVAVVGLLAAALSVLLFRRHQKIAKPNR